MTNTASETKRVYEGEHMLTDMLTEANRLDGIKTVRLPHGISVVLPVERMFASIETIQMYVDRVLGLTEVREAYPERASCPCAVRARKGDTKAHYQRSTATIAIPYGKDLRDWAMRETVVLHELAHHLSSGHDHDVMFRRAQVLLLNICMGAEVGLAQTVLWDAQGLSM